jgi:hypothetical protein
MATALELRTSLTSLDEDVVLVASDDAMLHAAEATGIPVFNPTAK